MTDERDKIYRKGAQKCHKLFFNDYYTCFKTMDKMVEDNTDIKIFNLINSYLSGDASDEETALLCRWMEESEENRNLYVEMAAIKRASEILESVDSGEDRMMERLNARISSDSAPVCETPKKRRLWGWMAAAVAAAAVALVLLYPRPEAPLQVEEETPYVTYVGNSDEISAVILDDGTRVWLGGGASLKYRVEGNGCQERVALLSGKAFFDVCKDSIRPFIVKTKDLNVRVLGTSFIVETEAARTSVYLERGSVRLQTPEGVNLVRLHPDQKAVYNAATSDIEVETADVTPYLIRKYNSVSIENASVPEMIRHIEDIYGVKISIESPYEPSQHFDLNYQRTDSIEQVLDIVRYLTGTHCRIATE